MSLSIQSQLDLKNLAKGRQVVSSSCYNPDPRRSKRVLRERDEQVDLVNWADRTVINGIRVGDFLCHMPNEGKRGPQAAGDFIRMGGRKGYPDLMLEVAAGGYHGLRIELKAPVPYDAPVTVSQKAWIARLRSQGYRVEVCRGAKEAKALIIEYLNSALHDK